MIYINIAKFVLKRNKRERSKRTDKKNYIYRLSSDDKTLSSLIKKRGLCTKMMVTTKYLVIFNEEIFNQKLLFCVVGIHPLF